MQWKISLRVLPGSKNNSMEQDGTSLKIRLNAPAVDGKANAALRCFLAKQWGLRKSALSISAGEKSRNKTLCIEADTLPAECSALIDASARSIS